MVKLLKSIGWGFCFSVVFAIAIFILGSSQLSNFYIESASSTIFIMDKIIPSSFVYLLFPDGGGPAGVGLIISSAIIQWGFILSVIVYFLIYRRGSPNQPIKPTQ
ncbi:hypothetical protein A3196_15445 [Candidatus Thiodiazotropha endoloripes]|uniref:Uncharacterized protein n=1 Tax=Candidatus Thiodiazotropha endoloripes TaxID=1818881 RepID=A0A1E2UTE2_9GAMM|nr:hypothetical protein A3196_15445 [Candidatus Thiodiazotropha endoloripes]